LDFLLAEHAEPVPRRTAAAATPYTVAPSSSDVEQPRSTPAGLDDDFDDPAVLLRGPVLSTGPPLFYCAQEHPSSSRAGPCACCFSCTCASNSCSFTASCCIGACSSSASSRTAHPARLQQEVAASPSYTNTIPCTGASFFTSGACTGPSAASSPCDSVTNRDASYSSSNEPVCHTLFDIADPGELPEWVG